ncbi:MAG: penicillin-binding protein activator [Xanthomonadaceae bacterium]|nr:penicillin-binding protein activator [Xanthomonadaceae bacterium]
MTAAPRLPILLLLLFLLAGCATSGPQRVPVDDAQARALFAQGDFRAAAAEYQRLAKAHRGARDRMLLAAADSLREDGDLAAAMAIADDVRRPRLDPAEASRLDLLLAEGALAAGDAERALSLATLPESPGDPGLGLRAGEVRARALEQLGRPLDGASERIALLARSAPAERGALEEDILEALAGLDPPVLSRALATIDAADARRPWLERALRLKGGMPSRVIPRPTRQAGTLLPQRGGPARPEGWNAPPQVALLLPLSGPLAAAGGAIRDGFLAAYFADTGERAGLRIIDAGATPDSALQGYRDAVAGGATRVVGPLAREQVAAVLAAVDPRVPVLALNHPDSGAPPPPGSQQFALAPEDEAALAADAAYARGLRRMAVIAAAEEWSERAALAFRAQFEMLGGVVAGESRLPAEVVDFAGVIGQALAGTPDGAFLAVRPAQGRLLVPQLRARGGLQELPLLATSHVFEGNPNRALDRDLNGLDFCDAPWLFGLAPGLPPRDLLARSLPGAASAPRLFAFGIDAWRLLPYLDWLGANPDAYLPGASGQLAVDGFGRVRRLPTWMRFVDGVPRAADGLLSTEPLAAPASTAPAGGR